MRKRITWKEESAGAMRRTASAGCDAHCLPFRDNMKRANLVLPAGIAIYRQIITLLQCLQESIACSSNKSTLRIPLHLSIMCIAHCVAGHFRLQCRQTEDLQLRLAHAELK